MSNEDKESWDRIGQHVIISLKRMEEKIDSLEDKLNESNLDTHVEITALKVKAGLWGTIAGIIAGAIVSIVVGYIVYGLTKAPHNTPQIHLHPQVPAPTKQDDRDNSLGHSILCPRDNERLFSIDGRYFIV